MKENLCPNRQTACDDETTMYQLVRRLERIYGDAACLKTNSTSKREEKSTSAGSSG